MASVIDEHASRDVAAPSDVSVAGHHVVGEPTGTLDVAWTPGFDDLGADLQCFKILPSWKKADVKARDVCPTVDATWCRDTSIWRLGINDAQLIETDCAFVPAACCDAVILQSEQVVKFEAATDVYSVSVADVPLDEVRAAFIVVLAAVGRC